MKSIRIEDYSRNVRREAYTKEQEIKEELKKQSFGDDERLNRCLDMLRSMRKTTCNCAGYLESFLFERQSEEPDKITVEWAEKTLQSLWKFEYGLLDMYVEYTHDPEEKGKIIPVHADLAPGMITVDIDTAMPNKKNAGLRSSSLLSYILDESFRVQVGQVGDDLKMEHAYVLFEHHAQKDTPEMIKRYPYNYDTYHLLWLVAHYFMKHGAGPEYARIGEAVIEEERVFTRVRIVSPDKIESLFCEEKGFFQW